MQGKTISKVGNTVINLFSSVADKISGQVNFIRRKDKAKLTAKTFFKVLILGCLSKTTTSLEEMCLLFKEEKVKISKQGLHQRFNTQAANLMKRLFEESITRFKTEQNAVIDLLKPFSGVKILDSSTIALPPHMKKLYCGCGGSGPEAALKLQAMFDYVKGHLDDITLTDARKNDQGFKGHLDQIEKEALYLQDLGYFDIESFIKLQKGGAYYISRHFNQTALFDKHGQRVDLISFMQESSSFFTKEIWIGRKDKIPVRMIGYLLPDSDAEKRVWRIKENARRHGKTPKQETLNLAKWSICITNVPIEILKDEQVYLLYSLRWQIELFFKLCKQEAGIDKIKSKKTNRVLCEIYARLICVTMLLYICSPVRWQKENEISFSKAYNCMRKNMPKFFEALGSIYRLQIFLKKFLGDLQEFGMKDIKRKKPATHQRLMGATGQEMLV